MPKPTSAVMLKQLGGTLLVRNQQSVFNALIGSALTTVELRAGDIVALTWHGDVAYAMARLGHQELPIGSTAELVTPPPTPYALTWTGEKLTWLWGGKPRDLAYYVIEARDLPDGILWPPYPVVCWAREHALAVNAEAHYRVRAVGVNGNSSAWSAWSAKIKDTTPPQAPRDVTWTAGPLTATIRWSLVVDSTLAAVELYVRRASGQISTYTLGPTATDYTLNFYYVESVEINLRTRDYANNYSDYSLSTWLAITPNPSQIGMPYNGDFTDLDGATYPAGWVVTWEDPGATTYYPYTWVSSSRQTKVGKTCIKLVSSTPSTSAQITLGRLRSANATNKVYRHLAYQPIFYGPITAAMNWRFTAKFLYEGVWSYTFLKVYLARRLTDTPYEIASLDFFADVADPDIDYSNMTDWVERSVDFEVSASDIATYGASMVFEIHTYLWGDADPVYFTDIYAYPNEQLIIDGGTA